MQLRNFPRFANKAAVRAGLLAVTTLLAGSWQAPAESSTAAPGHQAFVPSTGMVTLANHVPSKVRNGLAARVSHYTPEQKLRLALVVQPPKMAEEEQFLKALTTKGSPSFHKFLSADEWNTRFGPSVADEQKVVDWATSNGFTVTKRYPNR
jgi:subtilase family serine protease